MLFRLQVANKEMGAGRYPRHEYHDNEHEQS